MKRAGLQACAGLLLTLTWVDAPTPAFAQTQRPGDERLDADLPDVAAAPPALRLPPIPLLRRDPAVRGGAITVGEVNIVGNTVLTAEDFQAVVAPYLARPLHAEDFVELRDAVTRLYIDRGYLNSGATLPEQSLQRGVLELHVVEGTLEKVDVIGADQFRPGYLASQLKRPDDGPLNVRELEQRLQLLRADPRIRRLEARLIPSERRGLSRLELDIEETSRYGLSLTTANDRSSTIGSEGARADLAYRNLTGNGDELQFGYGMTEGLDDYRIGYSYPLFSGRTLLDIDYRDSRSRIVGTAFEAVDIESESQTIGIGLEHALYRSPANELVLGLRGEARHTGTRLAGFRTSFSLGPDENGETRVSVLRLSQAWTSRSQTDVLALRSTMSFGLDILDATDSQQPRDRDANLRPRGRVPNGTFVAWLLQAQWAHRLSERFMGSQVLWRVDAQLTPGPLLSLEQFSLGGSRTVRGYRENELVRDNGVATSLELRIPILRTALGRDVLQLAPFFDLGHGWNDSDSDFTRIKTIASFGAGLRYQATDQIFLSIYYGEPLRSYKRSEDDLQNHGFHFQVSMATF